MEETSSRTGLLLGEDALARLAAAHVLLLGIGGVGSYCFEALVRTGVGHITVIDDDVYEASNLNRQLYAARPTLGQPKVDAAVTRAAEIAPSSCLVTPLSLRVSPDNAASLLDDVRPDVICDAIDCVPAKLAVAEAAASRGIPLLCCLGTGNRLDPTRLRICDVYATSGDPLARSVRRECRRRGIASLPCIVSDEEPLVAGSATVPSCCFVPAAAGMTLASWAVRQLT